MFTGIVEERGEVLSQGGGRLTVRCPLAATEAGVGDSIAVSGVCLTVVARGQADVSFDLSDETLLRTNLGRLASRDPVNLERPATLASRLGGHLVQGHVDAVADVTEVTPGPDGGARLSIRLPGELLRYVVEKGSITLDGVSLTVAAIVGDVLELALIPHTLAVTTLGAVGPGDPVNVEVDVLAKYVARHMEGLAAGLIAVEHGKERTA